ncbi:rCG36028, partial [Rattus norvegicus]
MSSSSPRTFLSVEATGWELPCCLTINPVCISAPQILLVQPDFPELEVLCVPATGDEEEVPKSRASWTKFRMKSTALEFRRRSVL